MPVTPHTLTALPEAAFDPRRTKAKFLSIYVFKDLINSLKEDVKTFLDNIPTSDGTATILAPTDTTFQREDVRRMRQLSNFLEYGPVKPGQVHTPVSPEAIKLGDLLSRLLNVYHFGCYEDLTPTSRLKPLFDLYAKKALELFEIEPAKIEKTVNKIRYFMAYDRIDNKASFEREYETAERNHFLAGPDNFF